jgi:hypothetical protein
MELVDGQTLESWQRRTPIDIHCAARLVKDMAESIASAHAQGVIHRDLKPANILVQSGSVPAVSADRDSRLRLKIADFGISRVLGDDGWRLTQTGGRLGTPAYMSPEQAAGPSTELGPATDIYSLGAILYQLLTGMPPFVAHDPLQLLHMIRRDQPVPPGLLRGDISSELETICLKCLEKQPRQRYHSAQELAEDLVRFLEGRPIRARAVGICGRMCYWVRRHPGLSISISVGAALLMLLAVGGLLTGLNQKELAENARTAQLLAEKRQAAAHRTWLDAFRRTEKALGRIMNLDWGPESFAQRDQAQGLVMELFAELHHDYLLQIQHEPHWGYIEVNAVCNYFALSRRSGQVPLSDPQALAWLSRADQTLRRIEQSPHPQREVMQHQDALGAAFGEPTFAASPERLLVDHRVTLNGWLAERAGNDGDHQRQLDLLSESSLAIMGLFATHESDVKLYSQAARATAAVAEAACQVNDLATSGAAIKMAVTHRRLACGRDAEDSLLRYDLVESLVWATRLSRKAGSAEISEDYADQARQAADADLMSSNFGEPIARLLATLDED